MLQLGETLTRLNIKSCVLVAVMNDLKAASISLRIIGVCWRHQDGDQVYQNHTSCLPMSRFQGQQTCILRLSCTADQLRLRSLCLRLCCNGSVDRLEWIMMMMTITGWHSTRIYLGEKSAHPNAYGSRYQRSCRTYIPVSEML